MGLLVPIMALKNRWQPCEAVEAWLCHASSCVSLSGLNIQGVCGGKLVLHSHCLHVYTYLSLYIFLCNNARLLDGGCEGAGEHEALDALL